MAHDIISFGEVLWDIIDGVPHIGGAPFNFAAHARRNGMDAALVSAVGADELGTRTRAAIRENSVDDKWVSDSEFPTGTVEVTVTDGMPAYEIKRPAAWDRIVFPADVALPPSPRAFYYGTLAARDAVSGMTLKRMLSEYADSLTFFDVNLRQVFWNRELVLELLLSARILKLNAEEAEILRLAPEKLLGEFPQLEIVVVTKGAEGCKVSVRDEGSFTSQARPSGPVVDTVGAGDAFSAAFLSAILSGKTPREAAEAGNCLGGWVAANHGAIPPEPT